MVSDTGGRRGPYINSAIASAGSGRGWGGGHTHHKRLCRARGLFLTLELGTAGPGWPFPISGIPNGRDGRAAPHTGNGETDHRDTNAMYRVLQPRHRESPPAPPRVRIYFISTAAEYSPRGAGRGRGRSRRGARLAFANKCKYIPGAQSFGNSRSKQYAWRTDFHGPTAHSSFSGNNRPLAAFCKGENTKNQGQGPLRGMIPSGAGFLQGQDPLRGRRP